VVAAAAADLAPQGEEQPATAAVANGNSSSPQKQTQQRQQGSGFSATLNVLRVDGGASHNDLLMQLQVGALIAGVVYLLVTLPTLFAQYANEACCDYASVLLCAVVL
jgi:hypothetical protein